MLITKIPQKNKVLTGWQEQKELCQMEAYSTALHSDGPAGTSYCITDVQNMLLYK